ncbi:MAG TPA: hypothetical protein VL574_02880, partial [Stellaceae bacterium]|nr:hypothetical protein [Stellaceae bacterium]
MIADAGLARIDTRAIQPFAALATPMEAHPPLRLILRLDATDEAALRPALTAALGAALSRAMTRKIERVYWDTADGAIGRTGFALGLRRSGTRTSQRMLAIGERRMGGRTVRDVEAPITGGRPDLIRLALQPGVDPHEAGALDPETLVPIFAIETKRTVWRAEWHGTRLVIGFDAGMIRSPLGEQPVRQLTIDSEAGPGATVYELAREIWPALKAQLAEFDEVQEGYRLTLRPDWWPDATKARLDPEMSTRQ